jgi:hypothetical protein
MGRLVRAGLPLLVWVAWAAPAFAAILPSFHLDTSGWYATHIVVVTEGKEIDGKVRVLESWRGDLRPGDRLDLPDLAAFAPLKARTINTPFAEPAPGQPTHVTGQRMVLFLRKAAAGGPARGSWTAASGAGMRVSLAWVEGEQTYACVQWINPGPNDPIPLNMTERQLRERVRQLDRLRADLGRAAAGPDAGKRAFALCPFLDSAVDAARQAAFQSLGECGEPALPTFRRLLADGSLGRRHWELVRALGKVRGRQAGQELAVLLGRELAFWQREGPRLPPGWWNGGGLEWADVERFRDRYGVALEAVRGLGEGGHREGRQAVREFRYFWRSLAQLREIEQMGEECDHVLAKLYQ